MSVKESLKKNSLPLAVIGVITAAFTTYSQVVKSQSEVKIEQIRAETEKEKIMRQEYEVYVSDYQDRIECKLMKYDSLLKNKTCK